MIRCVVLLAVALTALADKEDWEKCIEIVELPHNCCNKRILDKNEKENNDIKECFLIANAPGSCDRDMCIGNKQGHITADGSLKMDAIQKTVNEIFADHKDILEAVNENCIDGEWQSYGNTDYCDIGKINNCIRWHVKFRCTEFKDEGLCKGSKDMAKKCLEMVSP